MLHVLKCYCKYTKIVQITDKIKTNRTHTETLIIRYHKPWGYKQRTIPSILTIWFYRMNWHVSCQHFLFSKNLVGCKFFTNFKCMIMAIILHGPVFGNQKIYNLTTKNNYFRNGSKFWQVSIICKEHHSILFVLGPQNDNIGGPVVIK